MLVFYLLLTEVIRMVMNQKSVNRLYFPDSNSYYSACMRLGAPENLRCLTVNCACGRTIGTYVTNPSTHKITYLMWCSYCYSHCIESEKGV